ncbi:MAG: integrating conjugative element protein [gamma proteobacterium symbiont of Ctena orbiculata]
MVLGCLLVPVMARAELTVIHDSGHTQSIAPFLDVFESTEGMPKQNPIPIPIKSSLGAADPKAWLPIQSTGLTPGPVLARAHDRPFTRPFFLIGSDARSLQWLQAHRDRLKEIGAVGMLVQAETMDDLRTIARLADGLSILPASGSDIAKALSVSHYPVLISPHGIEQ